MILAVLISVLTIYKFVLSPRGNNEPGYKEYLDNANMYYGNREWDKARFFLNDAERIKKTIETKELYKKIEAGELSESVDKNIGVLKDLSKGDAAIDTKITEYLNFRNNYRDISRNEYTKPIISRVQQFISRQYSDHIAEAEEYIKAGELKKAHDSVKLAKALGNTPNRTLELEDRVYKAGVSAAETYYEKAKPQKAKENLLIAKAIKPKSDLEYLENKIEFLESMPGDVRSVFETFKKIEQNKQKYWEAKFRDGIVMVYIPAGRSGYWMGKAEVSVAQYKEFMHQTKSNYPEWDEKGSKFNVKTGNDDYYKGFVEEVSLPIVGISWNDAKAYCQWLSKKTGLTFKLPSEAQWEKAARGTDGRMYPWGNSKPGNNLANFFSPGGKTKKVVSYPQGASPYSLLNMAGNVEEWCEEIGVARGGSFYDNENYIKSTSRKKYNASDRTNSLGFRLCMEN